jgi:DNA-binding XRE family transcriptional regulator
LFRTEILSEGKEIRWRAKAAEQKTGLAAEYGVSRQTLYSALA